MTKKFFYLVAIVFCLGISSSAKQVSMFCIKENKLNSTSCIKKEKPVEKKIATIAGRPFHFYLLNI